MQSFLTPRKPWISGATTPPFPIGAATSSLLCQLCGQGFDTYAELNCHYDVTHSVAKERTIAKDKAEMKFTCSICSKVYKDKSNLRGHLFRAHGKGEAPFRCKKCGAGFAWAAYLSKHAKTCQEGDK